MGDLVAVLVVFVILAVVVAAVSSGSVKKRAESMGGVARFFAGQYLGGIPGKNLPAPALTGVITPDSLVFLNEIGSVFASLPRYQVTGYEVDDKSQMLQRLTATRIVTMGVFALAAPKRQKQAEFLLRIEWRTDDGQVLDAAFEFVGSMARTASNNALDALRQHIPIRSALTRKCTECAEEVSAEARLCKHCRSPLPLGGPISS